MIPPQVTLKSAEHRASNSSLQVELLGGRDGREIIHKHSLDDEVIAFPVMTILHKLQVVSLWYQLRPSVWGHAHLGCGLHHRTSTRWHERCHCVVLVHSAPHCDAIATTRLA
jgi:hypothetical protein